LKDRLVRLFWHILDVADYATTSVRLRLVDLISGSEPTTPADKQREKEHEQLQRAFPEPTSTGSSRGDDDPFTVGHAAHQRREGQERNGPM